MTLTQQLVDLHGKTILLTGANSGIGKVTALELARMGASLVLVCRNREKGKEAMDEFVKKTGNKSIELITADLLLQKEVRSVADEFLSSHARLDVLINNAGTNFPNYGITEDGIERTMAVNYFAPFLLTNLLLGVLEKSAPSRVVNVSSVGHFGGDLLLDNLAQDRRMGAEGFSAYQRSKLALVLFTYELARRLNGKQVSVNSLHPGTVRTNIWSHAGMATLLQSSHHCSCEARKKAREHRFTLHRLRKLMGSAGNISTIACQRNLPTSRTIKHLLQSCGNKVCI